jgi:hypothetical protein
MTMRRIPGWSIAATAIVVSSTIVACRPTNDAAGLTNPGSASQGDDINLSASYRLSFFAGGPSVDGADGATLTLGDNTYAVAGFGNFAGIGPDSGTYVALDTSTVSSVDAGTLIFTSAIPNGGTTTSTYILSSDSLTVNVLQPNSPVQNTVWVK